MKRTTWITAAFVAAVLAGAPTAGAAQAVMHDNVFDSIGDWFATVGRAPADKEAIKAQRKADRMTKRTEAAARREAKEAEKEIKNTADELGDAGRDAGEEIKDFGRDVRKDLNK
jgi:hypothetical protein